MFLDPSKYTSASPPALSIGATRLITLFSSDGLTISAPVNLATSPTVKCREGAKNTGSIMKSNFLPGSGGHRKAAPSAQKRVDMPKEKFCTLSVACLATGIA